MGRWAFKKKKIMYLFVYWLQCVFIAAHGFSLIAASGGPSLLLCTGLSLLWLLLLRNTGCRVSRLGSCNLRALRAQMQYLWYPGLVAPWHVASSQTRIKPVSLASQGGGSTTGPPGKPLVFVFLTVSRGIWEKAIAPHSILLPGKSHG